MDADDERARGFVYSVSFGVKLRGLLDVKGKSLQQAICDNAQELVGLLNKLSCFGGSLVLLRSKESGVASSSVPILVRYELGVESHCALITTDATPEVVSRGLSELASWAPAVDAVDTVVFLGRQDPLLTTRRMNEAAALNNLKRRYDLTLPKTYLQMDDILGDAERNPQDVDASALFEALPYREARNRERSILVGNGINRANAKNEQYSWENIIRTLAEDNAVEDDLGVLLDKSIPSPTKFEYLALRANVSSGSNVFLKLKRDIAQIVNGAASGIELPPPSIADGLRALHMDHWLTTNYDLVLERCLGCSDEPYADRKYLLHRTAFIGSSSQEEMGNGADLYHIHGIATRGHEDTICIGYEHYMGYVQRLRERLIRVRSKQEVAERVVHLLLGTTERSATWEELFFTSDMAIVGLGFDYEETDLWELLILRAAVLHTSGTLAESGIPRSAYTNRITYYAIEPWSKGKSEGRPAEKFAGRELPCIDERHWDASAQDVERMNALRGFDVEVRVVHARNYEEGYLAILDELKALPGTSA